MGKLDRFETNFVTKFVFFVQDRGSEFAEYNQTITRDVISTSRV